MLLGSVNPLRLSITFNRESGEKMKKLIFLVVASLFLVTCGYGSNSSNDSGGDSPATLTSVFLDSPVINADYKTQSRVTNL